MQKGFVEIAILIAVLVLAAIGGAYYLGTQKNKSTDASPAPVAQTSPMPDASPVLNGTGEIANWKTYKDPQGRFAFKYPSEFKESQEEKYVLFAIDEENKSGLSLIESPEDFSAYTVDADGYGEAFWHYDTTSKKWVIEGNDAGNFPPKRVEGDLEAYILDVGGGDCTGDRIIIPFPSYKGVLQIINRSCLASVEDKQDIRSVVDKRTKNILSTFKLQPK